MILVQFPGMSFDISATPIVISRPLLEISDIEIPVGFPRISAGISCFLFLGIQGIFIEISSIPIEVFKFFLRTLRFFVCCVFVSEIPGIFVKISELLIKRHVDNLGIYKDIGVVFWNYLLCILEIFYATHEIFVSIPKLGIPGIIVGIPKIAVIRGTLVRISTNSVNISALFTVITFRELSRNSRGFNRSQTSNCCLSINF